MSALETAALEALLGAGVSPEQMRHLNAVVAATSRATEGDHPDAIAALTMALALFAGLTRDPVHAIAAAVAGLERARDAYAKSTRARSIPS